MKTRTTFAVAADKPALVLYWPTAEGGLWNEEASTLVERLEDELEVFVTCVGSGRGSLRLNDAAAAARFMGCASLVVVSPHGCNPTAAELRTLTSDLGTSIDAVQTEWVADAIADTYRDACRQGRRAA